MDNQIRSLMGQMRKKNLVQGLALTVSCIGWAKVCSVQNCLLGLRMK